MVVATIYVLHHPALHMQFNPKRAHESSGRPGLQYKDGAMAHDMCGDGYNDKREIPKNLLLSSAI